MTKTTTSSNLNNTNEHQFQNTPLNNNFTGPGIQVNSTGNNQYNNMQSKLLVILFEIFLGKIYLEGGDDEIQDVAVGINLYYSIILIIMIDFDIFYNMKLDTKVVQPNNELNSVETEINNLHLYKRQAPLNSSNTPEFTSPKISLK